MNPSVIDAIYSHSEQIYPEEACGFILKDGTVCHAKNIAAPANNKINGAGDPISAFLMSVSDTLQLNKSFSSNNPSVVIYHSHPDVGAYFSDADKRGAMLDGERVHPVDYLVVDVKKGKRNGALLFRAFNSEFKCIERFKLSSV